MFVVLWRPILEREGGSNSHGTDRGEKEGRREEGEGGGKVTLLLAEVLFSPFSSGIILQPIPEKEFQKKTFRGSLFKY